MTTLDIVLTGWCVSLLVLCVDVVRTCYVRDRARDAERSEWRDERREYLNERRELLSRIQRPDHLPVAPRPEFLVPERELDEWNRVGQIVIDPEYGLDETD